MLPETVQPVGLALVSVTCTASLPVVLVLSFKRTEISLLLYWNEPKSRLSILLSVTSPSVISRVPVEVASSANTTAVYETPIRVARVNKARFIFFIFISH